MTADPASSIVVNNVRVELIERGHGKPLLFLHPEIGIEPAAPVLDQLASRMRVLAPVHPGFGRSEQPKSFDTVDDLAYFYLDLLEHLDLRQVTVVGVSFGGWLAAEIAIKSTERLSHLVLANAVGIKVSDRDTRDIVDIYAIPESEYVQLAYFNPDVGTHDYKTMPDAQVLAAARNREATARYAWSPTFMLPSFWYPSTVLTFRQWCCGERTTALCPSPTEGHIVQPLPVRASS